jgi:hypothetical protein
MSGFPLRDPHRRPTRNQPLGPSAARRQWVVAQESNDGWHELDPVLRGLTLNEQDDRGPPVVIINQALAKQLWAEGDPLDSPLIAMPKSRCYELP